MLTFRTRGIIIKKNNLQEADQILTLFTDNLGKVKVYARGVRKSISKLSGHLDLFTCCDLILAKGRNISTIISAQEKEPFLCLKNDLKKTSIAFHVAELIDKFVFEEYKDTRIFRLIYDLFLLLNQKEIAKYQILILLLQSFKLKLLNLLGFFPEFTQCVHCKKSFSEKTSYFSSLLGGALCVECRFCDSSAIRLQTSILKILSLLGSEDFNIVMRLKILKKEIDETEKIINQFIQFLLEKKLKSKEFMKQVECLTEDGKAKI